MPWFGTINHRGTEFFISVCSAIAPALLYLLHPCSRLCLCGENRGVIVSQIQMRSIRDYIKLEPVEAMQYSFDHEHTAAHSILCFY